MNKAALSSSVLAILLVMGISAGCSSGVSSEDTHSQSGQSSQPVTDESSGSSSRSGETHSRQDGTSFKQPTSSKDYIQTIEANLEKCDTDEEKEYFLESLTHMYRVDEVYGMDDQGVSSFLISAEQDDEVNDDISYNVFCSNRAKLFRNGFPAKVGNLKVGDMVSIYAKQINVIERAPLNDEAAARPTELTGVTFVNAWGA